MDASPTNTTPARHVGPYEQKAALLLAECPLPSRLRRLVLPVLMEHNTSWRAIAGPLRIRRIKDARWAVIAVLHRDGCAHYRIGHWLNKDHTSIMHAVRRMAEQKEA